MLTSGGFMKKLLLMFLTLFMLTGCRSTKKDITSFFVEDTRGNYALYNLNGKQLTSFEITNYEVTKGTTYLVYRSGEVGLMDSQGNMLIPYGMFQNLKSFGDLFVTINEAQRKKLINKNGEVLYDEDQGDKLFEDDLLYVYDTKDALYRVFNDLGEEIYTSEKKISSVKCDQSRHYIYIGFGEEHALFLDLDTKVEADLLVSGDYVFESSHQNSGFILNNVEDATHKVYIDKKGVVQFTTVSLFSTISFDEAGNIIGVSSENNRTYLLKGQDLENGSILPPLMQEFNAFYMDFMSYTFKNEDNVYGPHYFYKDGTRTDEQFNTQISPEAGYSYGDIFPIYMRNEGFYYYNYEAKQVFETMYEEASPFDANGLAVVKIDGVYQLMDKQQTIVTKEGYSRITLLKDQNHMSSQYYIVENEQHRYGVIDSKGDIVVPIEYVGYDADKIFLTVINQEAYLNVEVSGRSFVYNLAKKEKVCEEEGKLVIENKGYIYSLNGNFYTLEGRLIYQRDL